MHVTLLCMCSTTIDHILYIPLFEHICSQLAQWHRLQHSYLVS